MADALRASLVLGALGFLLAGDGHAAVALAACGAIAVAVRAPRPPAALDLLFVAPLALDVWLTVLGAFETFNKQDRIGHLLLPAAVTPLLAHAAERAGVLVPGRGHPLARVLVVGALGTSLGAVWELCEWASDAVLGTNMSLGYADTLGDLACDAAASFTAAAVLILVAAQPARPGAAGSMAP